MGGMTRRALLGLAAQAAAAVVLAPIARAAAPIYHGPRDERVIALTIDDDWSAARVASIFDSLQQASVTATWFPYANAARSDPGLWRTITAAGHPYANHTRTHPWMTRLTPAAQASELNHAKTILEDITRTPMLPVFRPPYGAWDSAVVGAAEAAGFPTVLMWDTSDGDTSQTPTEAKLIRNAMRGRNGSVLLTHGGPTLTPLILPTVIKLYQDLGFRFVTVPELLGWSAPGPPEAGSSTLIAARARRMIAI